MKSGSTFNQSNACRPTDKEFETTLLSRAYCLILSWSEPGQKNQVELSAPDSTQTKENPAKKATL